MSFDCLQQTTSNQLLKQITQTHSAVPLSTVRTLAGQELSAFAQMALSELQIINVSVPPAISFVATSQGLQLENEHPHAPIIKSWLNNNLPILEKFKEVEVLYEFIQATTHANHTLPNNLHFHIGLTSAGPIAYFETSPLY